MPTKTQPCQTGKHHGPEGRTGSKICVSRGRNVPSEISYKKLAIRFSRLAAGSLLAAALLPLRLLLLRLLVSAAAYWCLLLPAAACCCLLLPAAACGCLLPAAACCSLLLPAAGAAAGGCCCCCDVAATAVVLLSCCCNQTASKARNNCCCCCCAHKDTALPDGETPWPWRTNGVQNMRFRRPERPFWNLLQKACYTFLDAGYWLAASCYTAAVALTATDCSYCYWCCWNPRKKIYWSCCCAHKDTALPDGETPWPWRTNGVQNMRFPRPERPFWNLLQKACYTFLIYVSHTFLNAGYWLAASCCTAAVALTATDAAVTLEKNSIRAAAAAAGAADPSKRRFPARKPHATERRQRLLLLCPQRHSPAGRGNTMALKDERSPKYAFPEAGTSLLKSPTKSLLYVSRGWLLTRC